MNCSKAAVGGRSSCSAGAATDEQVLALNAGCDDFIAKPVNFQILEAKINAFWRIARMQQQIAGQKAEGAGSAMVPQASRF